MSREAFYRYFFFFLGLIILAFGLTLNTKTGLGATAIIAVSYSISEIWDINLGNATQGMYIVFILIQLILHVKKYGVSDRALFLKDLLQLPMSLFLTRVMNVFAAVIPDLAGNDAVGFAGSLAGRFGFLALALICTGVGSCLSLHMRLSPSPGDGIVQAAADYYGISTGLCKNLTDLSCVLFAAALSFLCTGSVIGVGIGTIAAVIFVGRVMAVFDYFFKKRIRELAGMTKTST